MVGWLMTAGFLTHNFASVSICISWKFSIYKWNEMYDPIVEHEQWWPHTRYCFTQYIGDATDWVTKQLHGGSVPFVVHDLMRSSMYCIRICGHWINARLWWFDAVCHNTHPRVLGVTCYGHDDVQYGTAVMTPNIRTHSGDTANTLTR